MKLDQDELEQKQIVITVKTLWSIVGVIIVGLTTLFGLLTSQISDVKDSVDKLDVIKVQPLDDGYHELDKKVYYLLMRTNSKHELNTTGTAPETHAPGN